MSWSVAYLVLLVLWLLPASVIIASGRIQMKALETGNNWQCPSNEERERTRNKIDQITNSLIFAMTGDIHTCNGTPGWRRVAFINMTNTSYNCPTGLKLTSYSKRTCGRSHTTAGCSSTTFSVGGLPYSRVCGRMRGYQWGSTGAFFSYYTQVSLAQHIDGYYVDGVSLTHGGAGRRQHIWTFAAGITESSYSYPDAKCPCDTGNYTRVPAFVGNDYFCESGLHSAWSYQCTVTHCLREFIYLE